MTQAIKLDLNLQAVNVIMTALAHQPYAQVAELIQVIKTQAEAQLPTMDSGGPTTTD